MDLAPGSRSRRLPYKTGTGVTLETIGLIPAAGFGTRMKPFRYPKELFPIAYRDPSTEDKAICVRVVCQDAFDCLAAASISKAFVIISDHKSEVMRFLSDGRECGVDLAYLHQREVCGLPNALSCAYPWIRSSRVALLLPDTLIEPQDSIAQLLSFLETSGSDIVLGVFPTPHPEDLCPVEFDEQGRVTGSMTKMAAGES